MNAEKIKTTYREAMRAAIRDALLRDERVFLMGEDVGRYGGCFRGEQRIARRIRPERIRDTPLSESAFVGAGIGAAMGGLRPIVEIMTVNFSLLGARSDRQQRGDDPAYVRRTVQYSSGDSHDHRRGPAIGGATLA